MPKYIFDLERGLDFQRGLTRELSKVCEVCECDCCKYDLLCNFNIKTTTQLYLFRQRNNPLTNE